MKPAKPYSKQERSFLPYGRQSIDELDLEAVAEVLRSDMLTTGPTVAQFEHAVSSFTGTPHAAAVNSGTAALHTLYAAAGVGAGDEVILPPLTFLATANAAVYCGAIPKFADVDPVTGLIDPDAVEALVNDKTRAIVAVDYAGQPADYKRLRVIAKKHGLKLFADACHSLGAERDGQPVGQLADASVFSFHPVKHITTAEGGMIVSEDRELIEASRRFRNHGIDLDHSQRTNRVTWEYEMPEPGYNYRLSDLQSALGISQLNKLPGFLARRRELAAHYRELFEGYELAQPLALDAKVNHAWHLFVVRLDETIDRRTVFEGMRERNIGVNVHYIPVHLQPYYRQHFGGRPGLCPAAEQLYESILTLPLFPAMDEEDVEYVVETLKQVIEGAVR